MSLEKLPYGLGWIKSSRDPNKVSLTVKGAIVFVPLVVGLFKVAGVGVEDKNLIEIVQALANLSGGVVVLSNQIAVVVSSAVVVWGLVRKLWKPAK